MSEAERQALVDPRAPDAEFRPFAGEVGLILGNLGSAVIWLTARALGDPVW
jgi:hypothetical protein